MDWQDLISRAGQQNALFWSGAAAVALGFALLTVTLFTRVRRSLRRPFALPRISARRAAAAFQASGTTTPTAALPYAADAAASLTLAARALAESPVPLAPSLAILLRRLQLAGDRLEEVARAAAEDEDSLDDTSLKEDLPEVEYVFKACAP